MCNVWLKIANYILRRSNLKNLTFDRKRIGSRIFDIRWTADRMSKIRHPKKRALDVEYSTFDERLIECRKSDIRRSELRMSNIRHSTVGRSNRKNPIQQIRRIEFATFDPTECTRLIHIPYNSLLTWILILQENLLVEF